MAASCATSSSRLIHRELDARAVDRRRMADWHGRAKAIIADYKLAAYRAHKERG